MGFNLDDYEPVKDRITRFYSDHKDGRILTELVSSAETLDTCAAFKALVYIGEVLTATGYAYEKQGQGNVNRDSWVENAETSAIGRALANADYCGSLRPSREEMEKVGRAAPKPPAPKPPAPKPPKPASYKNGTPENFKRAKELGDKLGLTDSEKAKRMADSSMDVGAYIVGLEKELADMDAIPFGLPPAQELAQPEIF